jgi:hypothetical protein
MFRLIMGVMLITMLIATPHVNAQETKVKLCTVVEHTLALYFSTVIGQPKTKYLLSVRSITTNKVMWTTTIVQVNPQTWQVTRIVTYYNCPN